MHERPTKTTHPVKMRPNSAKKKLGGSIKAHRSAEKKRHRTAVGIGVVTEMTYGDHAQSAKVYYAAGISCEQALFAGFSDLLGLSIVRAQQEAPKRKDREAFCGAYIAAQIVLLRLLPTKALQLGERDGDAELEHFNPNSQPVT